jgi:hypothetical protein
VEKVKIFKKIAKIPKFLSTISILVRQYYRFISFSKKYIKRSTFWLLITPIYIKGVFMENIGFLPPERR